MLQSYLIENIRNYARDIDCEQFEAEACVYASQLLEIGTPLIDVYTRACGMIDRCSIAEQRAEEARCR